MCGQRGGGRVECVCTVVVNSGAFFLFFFCFTINHKYIKKYFSGEVKESVNFPFFVYFTRELNLYSPV